MTSENIELKVAVKLLLDDWKENGIPAGDALTACAKGLERKKNETGGGIWPVPPVMLIATLDDAIGSGLEIIHRFARAVGVHVRRLGLMCDAATIAGECILRRPHLLGLTVLQFDSEDDVKWISQRLPEKTRLVAGGPVFSADPEMADRCGIHFVARDVGAFLRYLVDDFIP